MKKTLIGAAAATLILAPFLFVSAQTTTPVQKRLEAQQRFEERKETLQQKREEIQNRFEEKRAEMQQARQQKVGDILERVSERFQSAIDRLTSFADRIDARLDLLADKGVVVDVSQGLVDSARDTLGDAQEALNNIELANILEDFGTTTPSGAIAELRVQLGAVKDLIRKAHGQLVDAIVAIKAGLANADDSDDDEDGNNE